MSIDRKPHLLDYLAEAILVGLLAYLPFAYGGVLPLSHLVIVGTATSLAICLGLRNLLAKTPCFVWSWTFVPVAFFVALVAGQLVPLPIGLVETIAPSTAAIWRDYLGDVSNATIEHVTLSLYPGATTKDLRLLLAGAVIFFVVVNVYRSHAQFTRLLAAVAVIGMAVVVLAFLQNVADSSTILWVWDLPDRGSHSGPFVHYGHFSQFVNLSVGAAIGLLLVRVAHRHAGSQLRLADVHRGLLERYRRLDLVLVVFMVLAIVAIALSRSRNGLISMLVAAVVITAALQWSKFLTGFGWSLLVVVLVAFTVLLAFGFDPVYDRLSTLNDDEIGDTRLALLRDTITAWWDFPLFGVGQGTFEWAFPMFDQSTRPGTAQHAEDQYAEFLVETGAVGFVALLAIWALVARSFRAAVRGESSMPAAVAFGLGFGLVAVFFHAFTDFGLRTPAVGVLVTVCMALPVALVHQGVRLTGISRLASVLVCLLAAGLLMAMLPGALAASRAELVWRSVEDAHERLAPTFKGTPAEFEELLRQTSQAVALQPDDIEYHYWNVMHAWHLGVAERSALIEAGDRSAADASGLARRIQAALLAGVRLAPTHGPTWAGAGDLGVGWLHEPAAGRWIHRAMKLAPHHPAICLTTGRQLLVEGKTDAAAKVFRRAVRMGTTWQHVQSVLIDRLNRPAVAREVARGDLRRLLQLGRRLAKVLGEDDAMVVDMREEAYGLMQRQSEAADAPAWVFAGLGREYLRRGEDERAVRYLRKYLLRVPRSGDRLLLVKALIRLRRDEEARQEVERLLRVNPRHGEARRILLELRTK